MSDVNDVGRRLSEAMLDELAENTVEEMQEGVRHFIGNLATWIELNHTDQDVDDTLVIIQDAAEERRAALGKLIHKGVRMSKVFSKMPIAGDVPF